MIRHMALLSIFGKTTALLVLPLLAIGACANVNGTGSTNLLRENGWNEAQTVYTAKVDTKDPIDRALAPFDRGVEEINKDINKQ
jgi:hypothetical protein